MPFATLVGHVDHWVFDANPFRRHAIHGLCRGTPVVLRVTVRGVGGHSDACRVGVGFEKPSTVVLVGLAAGLLAQPVGSFDGRVHGGRGVSNALVVGVHVGVHSVRRVPRRGRSFVVAVEGRKVRHQKGHPRSGPGRGFV